MSNQETCPKCGAEKDKPVGAIQLYKCGTLETSYVPASECYHRQLAQKDAEIERLKQAVLDEREACIKVIANYSHIWWDWAQFSCKTAAAIRARGEVK